jgi:hypothetical protein
MWSLEEFYWGRIIFRGLVGWIGEDDGGFLFDWM